MLKRNEFAPRPYQGTTSIPIVTDDALNEAAAIGRSALAHVRSMQLSKDAEFTIEFSAATDKTTLGAAMSRLYGDDTPADIQFVQTDGRFATFKVLHSTR